MSYNNNKQPIPYSWRNKNKVGTLSVEAVRDIKSVEKSTEYYMDKYSRSRPTIQNIQNGKTYI